jgi:hypothetical protein
MFYIGQQCSGTRGDAYKLNSRKQMKKSMKEAYTRRGREVKSEIAVETKKRCSEPGPTFEKLKI